MVVCHAALAGAEVASTCPLRVSRLWPSCHRSAVPAEVVVEPAHWNGYAVQDEVVEGAGLAVTVEDEVGAVLQVDGAQVHQAVEDKRVVVALAGLPRMMAAHAD